MHLKGRERTPSREASSTCWVTPGTWAPHPPPGRCIARKPDGKHRVAGTWARHSDEKSHPKQQPRGHMALPAPQVLFSTSALKFAGPCGSHFPHVAAGTYVANPDGNILYMQISMNSWKNRIKINFNSNFCEIPT